MRKKPRLAVLQEALQVLGTFMRPQQDATKKKIARLSAEVNALSGQLAAMNQQLNVLQEWKASLPVYRDPDDSESEEEDEDED